MNLEAWVALAEFVEQLQKLLEALMTADPTTNLKILIYKLFHSLEPEMQRLFADEIEKYIGAERHPCADGCLALKLLKQIEVPRGQFQNQ